MPKNTYRNSEQDRRLTEIEKHLAIVNGELGLIKTDLAKVKTDICWLKKITFLILVSILGLIGLSLSQLFS